MKGGNTADVLVCLLGLKLSVCCHRNMDIVGVPEISAEAELLSAITAFLERVGLTSEDVCIKVSSRRVLQAVLARYGVPTESFGPVCIVVDKLDKLPKEKVRNHLRPAIITSWKRGKAGNREGGVVGGVTGGTSM